MNEWMNEWMNDIISRRDFMNVNKPDGYITEQNCRVIISLPMI